MTSSPTIYYLLFKKNIINEYDVYESHMCQEPGCFMTNERFVDTCLPGKVDEFVKDFQDNLVEGRVDGFEVEDYLGDGSQ